MSSNFQTFTITQARMGEPLQFQPALGSKELDDLVDAYVPGTASKSDKLSSVTLEFFTNATVDFSTGSLTRLYSVLVTPEWNNENVFAFENSPTQSQSSGFSPPLYTPSPASSMIFADSGLGSMSMTPPTRTQGFSAGRVAKKVKKDTKKAAEARLPGFSIMTKDGVDVTSSAGRGTKTKEQREHAHLMRIMKACDACKRKKVRCDPSHRRSQTDMSRSATVNTVNTVTSSSSSSSSSRPNPSPPHNQLPTFGSNVIDDFVLFPEGDAWNSDMALPEFDENMDLSHFNFDIGLNDFVPLPDSAYQSFDHNFDSQPAAGHQVDSSLGHQNPQITDQYGQDQWASAQGGGVTHTRPHPSTSSQDPGQGWLNDGVQLNDSPGQLISSQSSFSPEADWSILESSINVTSPSGDVPAASSMNRRQRRDMPRGERARNAALHELIDRIPSAQGDGQSLNIDALENIASSVSQSFSLFERNSTSGGSLSSASPADDYVHSQLQSPGAANGSSQELWGVESARAFVAESVQALKSPGAAYQPIVEELQRLQVILANVKSGDTEQSPVARQALLSEIEMLTSQLQLLLTRVKDMLQSTRSSMQRNRHNRLDPDERRKLDEATTHTRQLVSSFCTTINGLQIQEIGTGAIATMNASVLVSGNAQLVVSPFTPPQPHPQDVGVFAPHLSYSSMIVGMSSLNDRALSQALARSDGLMIIRDANANDERSSAAAEKSGSLAIAASIVNRSSDSTIANTNIGQQRSTTLSDPGCNEPVPGSLQTVSPTDNSSARPRPGLSEASVLIEPAPANVAPHVPLANLQVRTSQGGITSIMQTDLVAPRQQLAPNVGDPRSEVLCQGTSSSPDLIPVTVLEHATIAKSLFPGGFASSLVLLGSLVLLNYIGVTSLMLPLAALALAFPRFEMAISMMALAILALQVLPRWDGFAGLQTFALSSAPLFSTANVITKTSPGRVLSSRRTSLSPTGPTLLRAMFNSLSDAVSVF